jgi:tetratricopeptide (TPR) repeat protein
MRSRRRLRAWALVACVGVTAAATTGESARADETSPANVAAARRHFDRARADYGQGAYREAIGELEAAHTLDPNAKDLVFNLGVVHEKLADIDDALKWFRLYTTMNLTPTERERADAYVKRLEGAKKELDDRLAAQAAIVMGAKALQDRPVSPYITGRNGLTYTQFANEQATAHQEAVVADISFGVAGAAAAATAVLFFTRPRPVKASAASVSIPPLSGGGAVFVQGSF